MKNKFHTSFCKINTQLYLFAKLLCLLLQISCSISFSQMGPNLKMQSQKSERTNKNLFYLLFGLITTNLKTINGQSFVKTFESSVFTGGRSLSVDYNTSNFFSLGTEYNNLNIAKGNVVLAKHQSNGNLYWVKKYLSLGNGKNIIKNIEKGVSFVGETNAFSHNHYNDIFFIMMNKTNNINSFFTFGHSLDDQVVNLLQMNNSDYIIIGNSKNTDNYPFPFALRIDVFGNEVWSQDYKITNGPNLFKQAKYDSNNNFIITVGDSDFGMFISNINTTNGELIAFIKIDFNKKNIKGTDITLTQVSKEYFFTGFLYDSINFPISSIFGSISLLDNYFNLNTIQSFEENIKLTSAGYAIILKTDGSFSILNVINNNGNQQSLLKANFDFDSTYRGARIFQTIIPFGSLFEIIEIKNEELISIGETYTTSNLRSMYISKTDNKGNSLCTSPFTINVVNSIDNVILTNFTNIDFNNSNLTFQNINPASLTIKLSISQQKICPVQTMPPTDSSSSDDEDEPFSDSVYFPIIIFAAVLLCCCCSIFLYIKIKNRIVKYKEDREDRIQDNNKKLKNEKNNKVYKSGQSGKNEIIENITKNNHNNPIEKSISYSSDKNIKSDSESTKSDSIIQLGHIIKLS